MDNKRKPAALVEPRRQKALGPSTALTEGAVPHAPILVSDDGKIRGRPATGKRSNPEWKLFSHFLRKKTQRAAVAKLQAQDDGRDLSDVLQQLLEDWLRT